MTLGNQLWAAQQVPLFGAGEGNRTLVLSLEGFSSTIKLHPQKPQDKRNKIQKTETKALKMHWWRGLDSNQRTR
jgi:hypothetical protein